MSRQHLEFQATAKEEFSFLVDTFGYELTQEDVTFLRFEGNGIFVNVYHGRLSYEIGIELGRLPDEKYTLHEILSVINPSVASEAGAQASAKDAVRNCLRRIAKVFRENCKKVLMNDSSVFESIAPQVSVWRQEYTDKYQFGATKNRANEAWLRKDYPEARRLYGSISKHLTRTEERRLRYLIKKEY